QGSSIKQTQRLSESCEEKRFFFQVRSRKTPPDEKRARLVTYSYGHGPPQYGRHCQHLHIGEGPYRTGHAGRLHWSDLSVSAAHKRIRRRRSSTGSGSVL